MTRPQAPIRRGPYGAHSWGIVKVRELEDGELYPVRWRCRDCGTVKSIAHGLQRVTYTFPEGHAQHFPEGLPSQGKAGACPESPARDLTTLKVLS